MATVKQSIPMRTYLATVRKAHEAYVALAAAAEKDPHGYLGSRQLYDALSSLRRSADAMVGMVCRDCSAYGSYGKPDDPYTAYTCNHPSVPRYDVRTGEQISNPT